MVALAKGADLSHWQSKPDFDTVRGWAEFVALKHGDGNADFTDLTFASRWATLKADIVAGKMTMRIAYQWLDGSPGAATADALIVGMGTVGKQARGAFDFEDARASGAELIAAVKRYHDVKGNKSLVYGGAKLRVLPLSQRTEIAKYSDLWLADWDSPYPTIAPWKDWTFLQYGGHGIDLDEFNGDKNALKKYLGITDDPAPAPAPKYPGHLLKRGMKEKAVKTFAGQLKAKGYKLTKYHYVITEYFGSGKESAVKAFQRDHKLTVDGIVGPKTWSELFK